MKYSDHLSLELKYFFLPSFSNDLNKFSKLKPQKEKRKEKKTSMYNTDSELYNDLLPTYFDEYYDFSDSKRTKMDPKYDPAGLTLEL